MTAIDGRVTRRPLRAGGIVWPLVALAAFLVLWHAVATAVGSSSVVPGPLEVVRNFLANAGGSAMLDYLGLDVTSYAGNLGYTASVVLSGWAIGSLIGLVTGTAAARVQAVRNLVEPVTRIFGVVPVLVVAPFVLVWFGTSTGGKLALIAFFSAVTVCVIAQGSALALPLRYEEYAASLGATGRARLARVTFPATLGANLTGLRTALGQAWGLQAVAELLGAPAGIGRAIAVRSGTGDIASVLALILALGLVAVVCDGILTLIVRRLTRWQKDKETS